MARAKKKNTDTSGGRDNSQDETQRQTLVSTTPDKAEGDEKTVDEALKNQDEKKRH